MKTFRTKVKAFIDDKKTGSISGETDIEWKVAYEEKGDFLTVIPSIPDQKITVAHTAVDDEDYGPAEAFFDIDNADIKMDAENIVFEKNLQLIPKEVSLYNGRWVVEF